MNVQCKKTLNVEATVGELLPVEDNIESETDYLQERAVMQVDNKPEAILLHSVDISDESNLSVEVKRLSEIKPSLNCTPVVFVMHTCSYYQLAKKVARFLRKNGCLVIVSGDIKEHLMANHEKCLIAMQKEVDFTVPVLTEDFLRQINCSGRNAYRQQNDLESEAIRFMYNLALKEYSRSYCINYRIRPVCASYEIADKVSSDPLLHWCFQLSHECESPDLVENLQKTKHYLLNVLTSPLNFKSPKVGVTSSLSPEKISNHQRKRKNKKISTKKDPNLGKIIIKHQPYIHGKIAQGTMYCLNCAAISSHPLRYQWYKNGDPMKGERFPMLLLKNLFPDPGTRETKFEYVCEVSNKYKKMLSQTAIMKLDIVNNTTPFKAKYKVALLIANDKYEKMGNLRTPVADAAELAGNLKSMDFEVIVVRNLSLKEMKDVIHAFCEMLEVDSYAFFFFAGHGFEVWGQTYLLPVDCSKESLIEESICKEYILEKMQEKTTALNVILIDACRRPIAESGDLPELVVAPMKWNTVYGYATTFLNGAYEKGKNSFFVEHLKKYICENISIQEVLLLVQRDFANERSLTELQYPVLESSLCMPRKLCDPLLIPTSIDCPLPWTNSEEKILIEIPEQKCAVLLVSKDHMEVYFNGIDVYAFLGFEEDVNFNNLLDMEINIAFSSTELQVSPVEGQYVKDIDLKPNLYDNILFKKEIFGLQKMENDLLTGKVLLIRRNEIIEERNFCIKVKKVNDMKLMIEKLDQLQEY